MLLGLVIYFYIWVEIIFIFLLPRETTIFFFFYSINWFENPYAICDFLYIFLLFISFDMDEKSSL